MKYIMLQLKSKTGLTKEVPIIFPELLVHADVFEFIRCMDDLRFCNPISAGFLASYDMEKIQCYGESESMGLKSRGDLDNKQIYLHDGYHGLIKEGDDVDNVVRLIKKDTYTIKLSYFKQSGKYYSDGEYETATTDMLYVFEEVKAMHAEGNLPGLVKGGGSEFRIHVDASDHPKGFPILLEPLSKL